MRRPFAALALIVLAAACSPSATQAPSAAPATATAPAAASATTALTTPTGVRPSLPPDAPAIDEPYWLVDGGTETSTWKDKDGVVQKTMTGQIYEVIRGGGIKDGILVNGTEVALLTVHNVTGNDPIPGLNAIEEQYGAQIDDETPDPSLPFTSPTPDNPDIWTRTTQTRGGVTVYVRTGDLNGTPLANAYWWGTSPGEFRSLMLQIDSGESFDALLTAVLGPTE
jgi:hypothetical protein